MTHRVHAPCRIARWLIAMGEDNAAGAELCADDPRHDDPVPHAAGRLISPAADDGRARTQSQFRRGRLASACR